jgi:hypothetical protein
MCAVQRTTIALVGLVLGVLATPITVRAARIITGVNVVGIQQMTDQQQDALIDELHKDGITCVRTGIGHRFNRFIIRAAAQGINALVVVYPTEGGGLHMRPPAPSLGLQWGQPALTELGSSIYRCGALTAGGKLALNPVQGASLS